MCKPQLLLANNTYCCHRGITVTICCPGPVATGSPDQPRAIYSGTGLITKSSNEKESSKRMVPARVAELIGKAAYHKLDECWIARHPVLLMGETSHLYVSVGRVCATQLLKVCSLAPGSRVRLLAPGLSAVMLECMLNKALLVDTTNQSSCRPAW